MSKQIEEGCRAIIVNSTAGNDGVIVTVVKETFKYDCKAWSIDKKLKSATGHYDNDISDDQLKRIDDYDGNKTCTWESCEWQPEGVVA